MSSQKSLKKLTGVLMVCAELVIRRQPSDRKPLWEPKGASRPNLSAATRAKKAFADEGLSPPQPQIIEVTLPPAAQIFNLVGDEDESSDEAATSSSEADEHHRQAFADEAARTTSSSASAAFSSLPPPSPPPFSPSSAISEGVAPTTQSVPPPQVLNAEVPGPRQVPPQPIISPVILPAALSRAVPPAAERKSAPLPVAARVPSLSPAATSSTFAPPTISGPPPQPKAYGPPPRAVSPTQPQTQPPLQASGGSAPIPAPAPAATTQFSTLPRLRTLPTTTTAPPLPVFYGYRVPSYEPQPYQYHVIRETYGWPSGVVRPPMEQLDRVPILSAGYGMMMPPAQPSMFISPPVTRPSFHYGAQMFPIGRF